ncbi:MAG: hypothetical protein ABIT08_16255 [Bacteroidia bacterium]
MAAEELLNNIKSKYEVKYNRLQKTELPANYFGKGTVLPGNVFNEFSKMQNGLFALERKSNKAISPKRLGQRGDFA